MACKSRRTRRTTHCKTTGFRAFRPKLTFLESRDVPAPFTPGDLVILRFGDANGGAAYPGTAPIYLDEYTTAGVLVQSVPMPTSGNVGLVGNQPITADLTNGTGVGQLNLSFDQSQLTFAGKESSVG